MAEVNESLTQKVADLARLELSPQELKSFTQQLGQILNYVEQISQVDVKGVEPMVHPLDMDMPMREDKAVPFPFDANGKPKVLSHAPEVLNDGYRVPPIL